MNQNDAGVQVGLRAAREALALGRREEAESHCRAILQASPEVAEAWNLLGRLARGDADAAIDFLSTAVDLAPGQADFRADLSEVLSAAGKAAQALEQALLALGLDPHHGRALALAAGLKEESGDRAGALIYWEQAHARDPGSASVALGYGACLVRDGQFQRAVPLLREVARRQPELLEAWYQLACASNASGDFAAARKALARARQINSGEWLLWLEEARACLGLGRHDEALTWIERVLVQQPEHGPALEEKARIQNFRRDFPDVVATAQRAVALGYRSSRLQETLGYALIQLNRKGEALRAFAGALLVDPQNVQALSNLGAVALEIGINTPALECFEHVLTQRPDYAPALINKGKLLKDRGRAREGVVVERRALGLDRGQPADPRDSGWHNYLYGLLLVSELSPHAIAQEHRKWGEALVRAAPSPYQLRLPGTRGGRIRIGYMSPDLRQHSVTAFMEPLLREHDRTGFEVLVYATGGISDAVTERLKGLGHTWREVGNRTDREIADRINADRIDVLVELSGHTSLNRLGVCALRPAPVQVSYLGYPGTTGLPTIGYRLTDELADPVGQTEAFHAETLVRIPECGWCYDPGLELRPVLDLPPSERTGTVTFGCFNNIAKWNSGLVELWVEILRRVPTSILHLKAKTLADRETREEWQREFVSRGIPAERVVLISQQRSTLDHLAEYDKVDIALDTFPYHGTTTTCESLWAGVPVITLAGAAHVSRVGASLLAAVGLSDLVAGSREDYVRLAVELAANTARRRELRRGLRPRMQASPLMDGPGFARKVEACYRLMVAGRG